MARERTKIIVLLGVVILAVALLIWLLKPKTDNADNPADSATVASTSVQPPQTTANSTSAMAGTDKGMPELAPSLRGTEIDCPLQVNKQGQLVLTIGIRSCFDYFFSSLGEKTEAQLMLDIKQYLNTTLPLTAASYASKLLDQYVAYKHALQKLQPAQQAKTLTAESYQQIVNSMQDFQRQFFTSAEVAAFFSSEMAFNQFNIEQMKIHANKALTTQQKAVKVAALINQLPPELAEGVRPTMQYTELQQLTKEIQDKGGSAAELRAMRESLVGAAAADRLEQVDKEEASWQTEVNSYLAQREQIKNSGMDDGSKQQAMTALRERTFNSSEDRLRAQTYEMMRDSKK
jgi:lipase chaperone LimK